MADEMQIPQADHDVVCVQQEEMDSQLCAAARNLDNLEKMHAGSSKQQASHDHDLGQC